MSAVTAPGETLRKGLFKDAKNSALTLVFAVVIAYALYRSFFFVFFNEKVNAQGEMVSGWSVIRQPLDVYMVGTRFADTGIGFPMLWSAVYLVTFLLGFAVGRKRGEEPRPMALGTRLSLIVPPALGALVLMALAQTWTPRLLMVGLVVPYLVGTRLVAVLPDTVVQRRGLILTLLGVVAFLLQTGFKPSNVNDFGGLLLTVNVSFIAIIMCFPIGIVMALTRRSSFPLLRPLAVLYIELVRGVPLITLLFMGQFALGFFLPSGMDAPPPVFRAIVMFTLFSGAYVAEIVRGGLQSVPRGQTEAGQAVGLTPIAITGRIVLPQALRNSIPALVGQFIALLKDTTLLTIISLFDLLGVSDPILARADFRNQGFAPEVYAFVAFTFWIMTFSMSRASQRLETKLGVGNR